MPHWATRVGSVRQRPKITFSLRTPPLFAAISAIKGFLLAIPSHPLAILTVMLKDTLEAGRTLSDAALERLLPAASQHPTSIHSAMRHSVFAGGKRLRPILCMEAGRMLSGSLPDGIEELGAALEMLHT
jgi:hypothetical protein